MEYSIGAHEAKIASEVFYDLLATKGLMILGIRKRSKLTGEPFVVAIPSPGYQFNKDDIIICILPDQN